MHPKKMYDDQCDLNARVATRICENPTASEALASSHFKNTAGQPGQPSTAVCIYNTGLCATMPDCVEGHSWVSITKTTSAKDVVYTLVISDGVLVEQNTERVWFLFLSMSS